ncbi:MAG: hypothetical protein CVT99_15360 [Bacteroidetes bacterium HGW-Bacteroidetes-16]|nr:MAG: hypothetical protein CVT99_15360 [Bacteroidetes bacterium HGW-Bacteroidetes-16]
MDKEKLLLRLSLETDLFKAHVNRLKPAGYVIHQLDIELLRKKATDLYDLVVQFDLKPAQKTDNEKQAEPVSIEKRDEPTLSPKPEHRFEQPVFSPSNRVIDDPADVKNIQSEELLVKEEKVEFQSPYTTTSITATPVELVTEEKTSTPLIEMLPDEIKTEQEVEPKQKVVHTKAEPVKTTLDLFSSSSDNSLAGKLIQTGEDTSVAGKMQNERLQNIRSAIGINEKFLFVNALFKGDLSRYNRVIDDLNMMKTRQGTDTYLLELRIEGQWPEDHHAFLKLKEIVDRKF